MSRHQIYTVTGFQKAELNNFKLPEIGEHRCVGFYPTFFEAENAVMENFNDIHDNMYQFVIIEEISPGIKQLDTRRSLYQWDGNKYVNIPFPIILKQLSNFGIG